MKTLAFALQSNFIVRFYRYYIIDSVLIAKREGVRELLRRRGWRIVLVVGGYYLVRDTIVYLIIPYCIARGLF
jgi:hypothetical protein